MFLNHVVKFAKGAIVQKFNIFYVKSVVKKVITRATPGRSLVFHKISQKIVSFNIWIYWEHLLFFLNKSPNEKRKHKTWDT